MATVSTMPAPSPRQWTAGERVGGWQLLRSLGGGVRSLLFEAEAVAVAERRCALRLLPELIGRSNAFSEFDRQVRAGESVLESGIDPDTQTPWIATELVRGQDLERRLVARGRMAPAEVEAVVGQLVAALTALHGADAAHGDLRPRNVIVVSEDPLTIRLVGFGRAMLRHGAGEQPRANLAWCAPEQTRGDRGGAATDVWSLGLLTFWMLTGRSYWQTPRQGRPDRVSLLRELLLEPLQLASARAAALGTPVRWAPELDRWFARCLARECTARFGDVASAYVAWQAAAAAREKAAAIEPSQATGAEPKSLAAWWARYRRASPALVALTLALAVAAVLAGARRGVPRMAPARTGASRGPDAPAATSGSGAPASARAAGASAGTKGSATSAVTGRAGDTSGETARLESSCALGRLDDCMRLGDRRGGAGESEAASRAFERACHGGARDGCRQLERTLADGCERGRVADCTALGTRYAASGSRPREKVRAAALFRRACAGGDRTACRRLQAAPRPLLPAKPPPGPPVPGPGGRILDVIDSRRLPSPSGGEPVAMSFGCSLLPPST